MSLWFPYCLFYLSFTPLWISILFVDIKSIIVDNEYLYTEYISVICILIAAAVSCFVVFWGINGNLRKGKEGTQPNIIIEAKEEKTITTEYLLSYILPLFAFDFTKWDGIVLFLVFFSVLGFLCIKHNNFCVNIILEIADYRFYNCKCINEDGQKTMQTIISCRKLNGCIGDEIYLKAMNNKLKLDADK